MFRLFKQRKVSNVQGKSYKNSDKVRHNESGGDSIASTPSNPLLLHHLLPLVSPTRPY